MQCLHKRDRLLRFGLQGNCSVLPDAGIGQLELCQIALEYGHVDERHVAVQVGVCRRLLLISERANRRLSLLDIGRVVDLDRFVQGGIADHDLFRRSGLLIQHGNTGGANMSGDLGGGHGKAVAGNMIHIGSRRYHAVLVGDGDIDVRVLDGGDHRSPVTQDGVIGGGRHIVFSGTDHQVMEAVDLSDLGRGEVGAALCGDVDGSLVLLEGAGQIQRLRIRFCAEDRERAIDLVLIQILCPAAVVGIVRIGIVALRPVDDLICGDIPSRPETVGFVGRFVPDSRHDTAAVARIGNTDILRVLRHQRVVDHVAAFTGRHAEDLTVLVQIDLCHP